MFIFVRLALSVSLLLHIFKGTLLALIHWERMPTKNNRPEAGVAFLTDHHFDMETVIPLSFAHTKHRLPYSLTINTSKWKGVLMIQPYPKYITTSSQQDTIKPNPHPCVWTTPGCRAARSCQPEYFRLHMRRRSAGIGLNHCLPRKPSSSFIIVITEAGTQKIY